MLARAAADGVDVVAIDPHAGNDRGPQEITGKEAEAAEDHEVFHRNLEAAGVADRIRHLRLFSDAALPEVPGPVDLLYIDGAHRWRPAAADIRQWGAKVPPGGHMLIHDSFSSVGCHRGDPDRAAHVVPLALRGPVAVDDPVPAGARAGRRRAGPQRGPAAGRSCPGSCAT